MLETVEAFIQAYFEQFYLLIIQISSVGYGDSNSMPNLTYFKQDYWTITIQMQIAWLIYMYIMTSLREHLFQIANEPTPESY